MFDTAALTIKSVCSQGGAGEVNVSLSGIPLYRGTIDWTIPKFDCNEFADCAPFGSLVAGAFADLKGFPIVGDTHLAIVQGGVDLTINVSLPKPFDEISGSVTLRADLQTGLHLDGLKISATNIPIGPVLVKDFMIAYTGSTDTWAGTIHVVLPPPLAYGIAGSAAFQHGDFQYATAQLGEPDGGVGALNLSVGAPPPIFLQGIKLGVQASPFQIAGRVGLSIGPSVAGKTAVGIIGQFIFELPPGGWALRIDGKVSVAGVPLASAYLEIDDTGSVVVFFGGGINYGDCSTLCVNANISGWIDSDAFDAYAEAQLGVLGWKGDGKIDVSTVAVSACVDVKLGNDTYGVGIAYPWGGKFQGFTGCDLSAYRPVAPKQVIGAGGGVLGASSDGARPGAHAAQVTSDQLNLPAGLRGIAWQLQGANGTVPQVSITGPGGLQIQSTGSGAPQRGSNYLLLSDPSSGSLDVLLTHPTAGNYLITPQNGTSIAGVRSAALLPPPSVSAHVEGRGHHLALAYRAVPLPGQSVRFVEQAKGITHVLGTTHAAHGRLAFAPAAGRGGRREIIAEVHEGMTVRARLTVASYIAPPPPPIARPAHLVVSRHRGSLVIRWRRAANAARYLIRAYVTSGSKQSFVTSGTSVTVPTVTIIDGALVSVTGQSPEGLRSGPAALVRLAAPSAPKLRRAPQIVGVARVGGTLSCTSGTWSGHPRSYVYEWLRDGVFIVRAVHVRFAMVRADSRHRIACQVTARNVAGFATARSAAIRPGR